MMARWFTVLIALVAQGMALMSPVCLIPCVSPNGHECIELVGQGCDCCGCLANEPSPQTMSKSLVSDALSPWHDVLLAPTLLSVTDIRVLEDAGLPPLLLRPLESPHLTILATVVLRV